MIGSGPPTVEAATVVGARAWQTLFITSIAMFLVSMDVTIVSVALPGIRHTFRSTSEATLSWVFTAYNLTFAALLLLAGKLGDRTGRKRAFLGGLAVFVSASLLAALAPSAGVLIIARVLQAIGSALIYPASLALLLPEFPLSSRSMAIGVWGGIAGLGGAIAPTLGALLVQWAGWRSVFLVNIPFVAAAFTFGVVILREAHGDRRDDHFDTLAVPLGALAVGFLVLAVVQGQPWGWGDPRVVGCLVLAALLLPIFLIRSARHPAPLLDLNIFRLRSFSVANVAQAVYVGSFFGWLVLLPSFFVGVWGWSTLAAGFGLAPGPALAALLSPLAGRLADRYGHRWLVAAGTLLGAAGTAWWATHIGVRPNYPVDVLPGMILVGLGTTVGFATLTGAIMSEVPPRWYSMAGAARSTIFQLASAVGIAIAIALVGTPLRLHAVSAYARTWWMASIGSLLCALVMGIAFRPVKQAANAAHG
jgi:EmrB/QacA subfamily drug resistance transporter